MIEPRIYRAAFVPALLAFVLVMFSLESRPRPVPQGLAADVLFDGEQAAAGAREIAERHPDRTPGSPGDAATAAEVREAFAAGGFIVETQEIDHDGRELVNVVGRRAGSLERQIVIVAARDAAGVPDAAVSAADTAALIEFARVFEGRPTRKTLVLASVDGSTLGEVGTTELVERLDEPELVDAVLAISGLGAGAGSPPTIVQWGDDATRAGLALQRTVAESLREEAAPPASRASPAGQLGRLAFPLGIGAQGVLLEAGYDAVRISGDGELSGTPPSAPVDEDRLGDLGRATLRAVSALDQGPSPARGRDTYVTVAGQVLPGWALALLAATLLLPVLAAAVDALARARRRRAAVAPWLGWIAAGAAPFAVGFGLAKLLALVGVTPAPPPSPVSPDLYPLDGPALAVLGLVAAAIAGSWLALRRFVGPSTRRMDDAARAGAGVAMALVLAGAALALLLVDPFAALFAVPAVHLWMLVALVDPPPPARVRLGLVLGGLALPALLAIYLLFLLGVDPLSGVWYLLLLALGGHFGLLWLAVAATFAALLGAVAVLAGRRGAAPAPPPQAPTTRGPLGYAGPGSLGGTDSAIRR